MFAAVLPGDRGQGATAEAGQSAAFALDQFDFAARKEIGGVHGGPASASKRPAVPGRMGDVNDAPGVARPGGHSIQYQPVIAWPCRTNGEATGITVRTTTKPREGRVMEPGRASLFAAGISLAILLAPLSAKADLLGDVSACATRADPVTVRTPRSCPAQRAAIGFGRADTLAQSMPPARKRYSVKKHALPRQPPPREPPPFVSSPPPRQPPLR
jgi:hypothetical protein